VLAPFRGLGGLAFQALDDELAHLLPFVAVDHTVPIGVEARLHLRVLLDEHPHAAQLFAQSLPIHRHDFPHLTSEKSSGRGSH
jgi:hypothetical protein